MAKKGIQAEGKMGNLQLWPVWTVAGLYFTWRTVLCARIWQKEKREDRYRDAVANLKATDMALQELKARVEQNRAEEQKLVMTALGREARAKAALASLLQAHGFGEEEIEGLLQNIDSEGAQ